MSEERSHREEISKMSQEPRYAIWKPSVEWVDPSQPNVGIEIPGSASTNDPRYTKTSLRHELSRDQVHQKNKIIREASESHNATARPFTRQTSLISPPLHQEPVLFRGGQSSSSERIESSSDQTDQRLFDNTMSQKLIHNQYNSPIGMYSTEAIHKAIEAQSEEIAPGVKGFRSQKSPINMQSEVLKMIREEEEERQRAKTASSSSQSKCSQSQMLQGSNPESVMMIDQNNTRTSGVQHIIHCNQRSTEGASTSNTRRAVLESVTNNDRSSDHPGGTNSGQPRCSECGSGIVGPFARVENRFVHPHCFNCSTCGTSLKNSGYFSINEKLYCDIHAHRVADVMRLNHNFQPDKQSVEKAPALADRATGSQVERQVPLPATKPNAQPTIKQQQVVGIEHCCSCCNRSTTISSIFSRRGCSNCNQGQCNQIKIYQPVEVHKSKEMMRGITSSNHSLICRDDESRRTGNQQPAPSSANLQSRAPVCCKCLQQIYGPYILAGKTVWCKPCSAENFVCCTCHKSLLDFGFIEDVQTKGKYHCESCFERHLTPVCAKCNRRITELECLRALGKTWHTGCFVCAHCKCSFGNSKFYLEDNLPYCERDWNFLFTTKCISCGFPIEASDKWIEALGRNYHSDCFRCTGCQVKLEGTTFLCKNGKPYCRIHVR